MTIFCRAPGFALFVSFAVVLFVSVPVSVSSCAEINEVEVTIHMETPDPKCSCKPGFGKCRTNNWEYCKVKSWDKPARDPVNIEILYGNRIVGRRTVGANETWKHKPIGLLAKEESLGQLKKRWMITPPVRLDMLESDVRAVRSALTAGNSDKTDNLIDTHLHSFAARIVVLGLDVEDNYAIFIKENIDQRQKDLLGFRIDLTVGIIIDGMKGMLEAQRYAAQRSDKYSQAIAQRIRKTIQEEILAIAFERRNQIKKAVAKTIPVSAKLKATLSGRTSAIDKLLKEVEIALNNENRELLAAIKHTPEGTTKQAMEKSQEEYRKWLAKVSSTELTGLNTKGFAVLLKTAHTAPQIAVAEIPDLNRWGPSADIFIGRAHPQEVRRKPRSGESVPAPPAEGPEVAGRRRGEVNRELQDTYDVRCRGSVAQRLRRRRPSQPG